MATRKLIKLIDFTYLPDAFDEEKDKKTIIELCESASSELGTVAALCIHPRYVAFTKQELKKRKLTIPVATVVNFASGDEPLASVLESIRLSLEAGVDEIDLVMPYKKLQKGQADEVTAFLKACQYAIPKNICLKVIIESGVLTTDQVKEATEIVCGLGADFVKTSTGKIKGKGATKEAVTAMLDVLIARRQLGDERCGLKLSGGIEINNVDEFVGLVQRAMGKAFIDPMRFRLGSSALLNQLTTLRSRKSLLLQAIEPKVK